MREPHEADSADTWPLGTLGAEIVLRFHTALGVCNSKSQFRTFGESLTKSDQPHPLSVSITPSNTPHFFRAAFCAGIPAGGLSGHVRSDQSVK